MEERRQHEDVDMGEDETTTEYDTVVGSESLDGLTADFSDEDSTLLTLTNTTLTDDEEDEHNVQQHNERTPLYLEEKEKEKERDKSWHSATDDDDEGACVRGVCVCCGVRVWCMVHGVRACVGACVCCVYIPCVALVIALSFV